MVAVALALSAQNGIPAESTTEHEADSAAREGAAVEAAWHDAGRQR